MGAYLGLAGSGAAVYDEEVAPTTDPRLLQKLDELTSAVVHLAKLTGARLTRAAMCERLGISSKTLTDRVRKGEVPAPCRDGKWLLSEVVEWEAGAPLL